MRSERQLEGAIHKIAVLCTSLSTIKGIDDAFLTAGAARDWLGAPPDGIDRQREARVYAWVDGIKGNAPQHLTHILQGVASGLVDNPQVQESDKRFLRAAFRLPNGFSKVSGGPQESEFPQSVDAVIEQVVKHLPRAIDPLRRRRKGLTPLAFNNEYDVQDLLHALLRPWVADIRPEEHTPSTAGKSARVDFLLPAHRLVLEVKYVRDLAHGRSVGDEIILDIERYRKHPGCSRLWAVVYDPDRYITNPAAFQELEAERLIGVRIFHVTH